MKYFAQTFSYLKKNFLPIFLVMIVPSAVACLLSTPYWEVSFSAVYATEPYRTFEQTFLLIFDNYWKYIWPVVLTSALQIVASSLIMSAIDRHFRTGRMSLKSPFRLMNVTIVPIVFGVLIMSAVGVVYRFVLLGLVMLTQTITIAARAALIVRYIIVTVVAVGLFVLHLLTIIPMLYWAPMMFVYGYGLRDAAAYSFKMISGKKVFGGIIVPLVLSAGVQLAVGFLGANAVVGTIVDFVVYLFTNMYVTVYIIVSFYHVSELDRRDVVFYMPIVTEPVKTASPEKAKDKDEVKKDGGKESDGEEPDVQEEGDLKSGEDKKQSAKKQAKTAAKAKSSSGKGKASASGKSNNNKAKSSAKKSKGKTADKKPAAKSKKTSETADSEVKEGEDVV